MYLVLKKSKLNGLTHHLRNKWKTHWNLPKVVRSWWDLSKNPSSPWWLALGSALLLHLLEGICNIRGSQLFPVLNKGPLIERSCRRSMEYVSKCIENVSKCIEYVWNFGKISLTWWKIQMESPYFIYFWMIRTMSTMKAVIISLNKVYTCINIYRSMCRLYNIYIYTYIYIYIYIYIHMCVVVIQYVDWFRAFQKGSFYGFSPGTWWTLRPNARWWKWKCCLGQRGAPLAPMMMSQW